MTLEQIVNNVNRIPEFDVSRALTRPITNPFLKFAAGWLVGILVCGVGGIMIGYPPSDRAVRLMGVVVGVLFVMRPNTPPSHRDEKAPLA